MASDNLQRFVGCLSDTPDVQQGAADLGQKLRRAATHTRSSPLWSPTSSVDPPRRLQLHRFSLASSQHRVVIEGKKVPNSSFKPLFRPPAGCHLFSRSLANARDSVQEHTHAGLLPVELHPSRVWQNHASGKSQARRRPIPACRLSCPHARCR